MKKETQKKSDFEKNPELKVKGRGGYRPNAGRPKGSTNKTPSRRLIEQAVCGHFNLNVGDIEEAKVKLLQSYLKSGDKGLAYFCEILFGKPTDVLKVEADVKVTALKSEDDVDDLFYDEDDEDEEDEEFE